ncbi:DNA metabolism protein [Chryseobacterium indologenes]|uniref:TIGR03915 family putative DNA repair protein n=2 Tax=Chryseobacterium indologenes TaxID=253 RepID=UPI000F4E74B8|nr:TIGR03915 family putative DNA repair protein [Chryseobacterium indologenes]AYZ34411.1 DNA metabolism protein [Chryseobacterium indologenes]MBF6642959.1 TIGR03915 family putative DNA repair protein [Chryseobacterium indologenes]MEB4763077.1 TIGR03915 family putative DNA repair protein [Chryseobacterium indologenes]QQQ73157.1 TIGR03915 family putative DNA repair protein [Chryseobacterium indologenes]
MTNLLYDGSFDGLFTAIFEVFEYHYRDAEIVSRQKFHQENIFAEIHEVITQPEKSERVLHKLEQDIGKRGIHQLLKVFLSEDPESERLTLSVVRKLVNQPGINILENFADPDILKISKICKSVDRERHRMTAFVRFEKMQDGIFFSQIDPDFNVLPLIRKHFKDRYQDQKWMIYDLRRNYGILYDLENCDFFYPDGQLDLNHYQQKFHDDEKNYQVLWQRYFTKTNIVERKNLKLHVQHVPKRYWKYLTEKW